MRASFSAFFTFPRLLGLGSFFRLGFGALCLLAHPVSVLLKVSSHVVPYSSLDLASDALVPAPLLADAAHGVTTPLAISDRDAAMFAGSAVCIEE